MLKLGSRCNLDCPHCHQAQVNYQENPRLLDWIKRMRFKRITFSGGEPTMYWSIIRRYIETLDNGEILFRMPTNGTLLTDEMVEFFNDHRAFVYVSYDGEDGGRDRTVPIKWSVARKLKSSGMCAVFSSPKFEMKNYSRDLDKLKRTYGITWIHPDTQRVNWIHQTADNPNSEFGKNEADEYIRQYLERLESILYLHSIGRVARKTVVSYLKQYYSVDADSTAEFHGVRCCGSRILNVTLDGRLLLCPYGTQVIGTIESVPTVEDLDKLIPERCRTCEAWNVCHCSCVASVSDLDCYVIKTLRPKIEKLLHDFTFSTD